MSVLSSDLDWYCNKTLASIQGINFLTFNEECYTGAMYDLLAEFVPKEQKRQEILERFLRESGVKKREVSVAGHKMVILDGAQGGNIPEQKIAEYMAQYAVVSRKNNVYIQNNCFPIAADAVKARVAVGRIATDVGAKDFTSWGNHCINYDELSDGTVVAYDLTTRANNSRGDIDVLLMRQSDLDTLLDKIGQLYGGEWVVIQQDG